MIEQVIPARDIGSPLGVGLADTKKVPAAQRVRNTAWVHQMRKDLGKNEDEQGANEDEYTPHCCYGASTEHVPAAGEKAGNAEEYGQKVAEHRDHPWDVLRSGQPVSPKAGRALAHIYLGLGVGGRRLPCDGSDRATDQGNSYGDEQYDPVIARQPVSSTLPACRCCW